MNQPSHTLCGYRVIEPLRDDCSFLAAGPGGRPVVLKRLEADCLLRGGLHPSVRERLQRVREVAHVGMANLHGVGREEKSVKADAEAWLIWEYLPGQSFDDYAADPARSPGEMRGLARELALAVDSLHQQGIVHGALVTGNVLVSDSGSIRLTHVSPLLFDDPAVDSASVLALLEHVLDRRGEREGPLGAVLAEARSIGMPLAMLASRLGAEPAAITGQDVREAHAAPSRRARRQALGAALGVTAVALVGGMILWHRFDPRPIARAPVPPGTEISIRH